MNPTSRITVSFHAEKRLIERMGVKKHKIQRLAEKAWEKGSSVPSGYVRMKTRDSKEYEWKEMMGFKFVFLILPNEILLKTVLPKRMKVLCEED